MIESELYRRRLVCNIRGSAANARPVKTPALNVFTSVKRNNKPISVSRLRSWGHWQPSRYYFNVNVLAILSKINNNAYATRTRIIHLPRNSVTVRFMRSFSRVNQLPYDPWRCRTISLNRLSLFFLFQVSELLCAFRRYINHLDHGKSVNYFTRYRFRLVKSIQNFLRFYRGKRYIRFRAEDF